MDIDFEELKDDLDYDDIEKLKSMSEEDIANILGAVEDAIDEEWAKMKAEIIKGEYGDNIFSEAKGWFRDLYFKDHPDEKNGGIEDDEIGDGAFELFLQKHDEEYRNVLEELANDSIVNGGISEHIYKNCIEKVSQDLGLADSIIAYLYYNDGHLPLKKQ
jgi:hypothetical protein